MRFLRITPMQKSELADELRLRLDSPESLEQLKSHLFARTSLDVEAINGISREQYADSLATASDDDLIGFYLKGMGEAAHIDQLLDRSTDADHFVRKHGSLAFFFAAVEAGCRDMFDAGLEWRSRAKSKHIKRMIVASRRADLATIGALPGVADLIDAQIRLTAGMYIEAMRRCGGSDETIASYLDPYLQTLHAWGVALLSAGAMRRDVEHVIGVTMDRVRSHTSV